MYITIVNVTENYEELINEWFIKQIKERLQKQEMFV